jgi:proline racemase
MTSHTDQSGDLTISVIDSHTGGEPTRVVMSGFPSLAGDSVAAKRADLVENHMDVMRLVVNEPRGNEAMVAALLVEPQDPTCTTGVIFVDRSAALGMCGHGTIGLVETLRWLGRVEGPRVAIETPVGVITAELNDDGTVSIANVPSVRLASSVELDVPELGRVVGDVAYGGNTFVLVTSPEFDLYRPVRDLPVEAEAVARAAPRAGFVDVDQIELFGPPTHPDSDSRSFVLCPSGTYDRSPCGTGTSAKLACLAADGKLDEGDPWIQESITGSRFSARFMWDDRTEGRILPVITGSATVVGRGDLFIGRDEAH